MKDQHTTVTNKMAEIPLVPNMQVKTPVPPVIKPVKPIKIVHEVVEIFNCTTCAGTGLKDQYNQCPVCKGTGKI